METFAGEYIKNHICLCKDSPVCASYFQFNTEELCEYGLLFLCMLDMMIQAQ